jgi:hypothetical protein
MPDLEAFLNTPTDNDLVLPEARQHRRRADREASAQQVFRMIAYIMKGEGQL